MKIMYLTTLFKMTWEERKSKKTGIIILACIILVALAGVLSIRKAANERRGEVEVYQSDLANYEKDLEELQNSLTALQENLATAQEQYDAQKKYCDESIYMQMDGNAFYQGDIQYTITTSANLGYLNSTLMNYINGTSFRESLSEQLGGVDTAYLKEIITCSTSNNVLLVTVYHYDEDVAEQILGYVDKALRKQVPTIAKAQGEFTLTLLDRSVSQKGDLGVVNAQNGALNNLRTYTNTVADAKNAISNKQQEIERHQRENYPEEVAPLSKMEMVKREVIFLIIGVILGVCVLLCRVFLRVMLGKTISNPDYFVSLNLAVLGDYRNGTDTQLISEKVGQQINMYAIQSQAEKIYLNDLSGENFAGSLAEQYQKCLDENSAVISCSRAEESAETIQRGMVESGNVMFVIRYGETTYQKFEEFYGVCKQFHLNVIGVIVAGCMDSQSEPDANAEQ